MTGRHVGSPLRPALLVLTFVIAHHLHGAAALADNPASERHVARFEVRFMEMMIDHHAMATEMASICVQRASHEDLRQLCEMMISAQQEEIASLQKWLREWYGVEHTPRMDSGDRRQLERLAAASDDEFEIEFMTMMIGHHWTAVTRATRCVGRVEHDELDDLCENIITAQLEEIFQMRRWLCQWYGVCRVQIDGETHGTHAD